MTATSQVTDYSTAYQALMGNVRATIAGIGDEDWHATTAGETRPVGVVAHHLASAQAAASMLLGLVVAGSSELPPPFTMDDVHANNAHHAIEHANATRDETLALLDANVRDVAAALGSLRDEQLDTTVGEFASHEMTVRLVIEWIAIGHAQGHLNDITSSIAG